MTETETVSRGYEKALRACGHCAAVTGVDIGAIRSNPGSASPTTWEPAPQKAPTRPPIQDRQPVRAWPVC